jgi:hypothetical protein
MHLAAVASIAAGGRAIERAEQEPGISETAWQILRILLLVGLMTVLIPIDPGRAQEAGTGGSPAGMASSSGTPAPLSGEGRSRAAPVPLGATVLAGPLELTVRDVLIGPDAVAAVLAAAPTNEEPRDGSTYIAVNLAVRNSGEQPLALDNDDFALTGDSGLVRRFLGAQPPAPALEVTLGPGETAEGWVAFGVPVEEGSLLLLFDSLELGGDWADRMLALQEGAAIPDRSERASPPNDAGRDPFAPLGSGRAAVTEQWSVELLEVVAGAPAFDLVDYRTGALGVGDAAGEDGSIWVAMRFRVQNAQAGGEPAHFPVNAFVLVDGDGNPLFDVLTLTPPRPDAAGDYYPGAAREGWVMFDVPVDYGAATVRFLPFADTAEALDPRYFTYA